MTAPTEPTARAVRIDAQPGDARITLDGNPLPPGTVTAYQLEHHIQDALPTLILHTRQPGNTLWEGLARVAIATPQDPGEQVVAFLSGIDPAALQRAALDRDDLDPGKHGTTQAILQQLADWAQGRT
ncbi:hypothetical protein [Streptomyces sp. NPDC060243]|uniref:hypothetical protein n=1 Tax=Streptomyces sp. NPDC060243 TaxID=3347081 RepID=UPI00366829C3